MRDRFEQEYPAAHFRFRDAAIGGTGSQLGVFRLDRDVLAHNPDLVFVDFTANDDINSADPETDRDLVALRLNPWWYSHDLYTPEEIPDFRQISISLPAILAISNACFDA